VRWDFGELPISIDLDIQAGGKWAVFPGLAVVDDGSGSRIDLRLFQNNESAIASHVKGVVELYRIHFSKDLKFLKKHLELPANQTAAARYFGGLQNLEKQIYDSVVNRLFQHNIRSRDQFMAKADSLAARIIPTGRDLTERLLPVIDAYYTARTTLHQLETGHPANRLLGKFCRNRKEELCRLIPDNFVAIYDLDRLSHLPRYIKAIDVRTRRASVNFEKENLKAAELTPFSSGLQRFLKSLSPSATQEKRDAIENFFWLIEEFKVSLFAQELKTTVPVSKKRLQEAMNEIDRMI
jgi:ATP-dependent helicase HrpA